MIIPINFSSLSSNPKLPPTLAKISHDELVLIELQGSLEVEINHTSERDGRLVGKLKLDEATNKPTLLIGHHLLEGKIVNLPKPLAVIRRTTFTSPSKAMDIEPEHELEGDGSDVMDIDDDRQEGKKEVEWNVAAIINRKVIFSKRPMPIVNLGIEK